VAVLAGLLVTTAPAIADEPEPQVYQVIFDATGGNPVASQPYTFGQAFGPLPTPTRLGYSFSGWYSQPSGGVKYTSATKPTTPGDVTAYARWTGKAYKITFNASGGSAPKSGGKVTKSKSATMGKAYGTLPTTSKKGHSFAGWHTSGGIRITASSIVDTAASQTLYARWTAKQYTVKLNPRSGTVDPKSFSVTYAKTYVGLNDATRTGYTFKGWWTKSSGGSRIYSTSKVKITATQTLYAHWAAKKYTLSFDANGGSTPKTGSKVTASKSVTYAKTNGTLPVTARKGHTFLGWYTDPVEGDKISSSTKVKPQNMTLYAHWWANSYTVKFNPNSGKMPASSKTVVHGDMYGSQPVPTRTGYVFAGWYTKASGGDLVEPTTPVGISTTQTLYAHWLPAPATSPVFAPAAPQYEYGVFLGIERDQAWRLYDYTTVVIDAEFFTKSDIDAVKAAGIRVYSYLNIGSIETFRDVYPQFKHDTLGKYDNWPGEYWMNVANTDWQAYIAATATALVAKGVDGFFIDNADVYYHFKRQPIFDGLVTILNNLSTLGKDVFINGGDVFVKAAVLDPATPKVSITGVNQETVFSAINFKKGTLITQSTKETAYYKAYLDRVAAAGLQVILLEYVNTSNASLRAKIDAYCQAKSYLYFVATSIELDR